MRLTGSAAFHLGTPSNREQSLAILRGAVELGVNHIDTAAFYFSSLRSANELINTALSPYPDELVIVTKVGPSRDASGQWMAQARPDQLRSQVEENLRQLGRNHLDVVNLRRQQEMQSVAEHFGALSELRERGLIRHLGLSGIEPRHLSEALAIGPVVCVQNRYGVDHRPLPTEELVGLCAEQGMAFVPFFAVAGSGGAQGALEVESDEVVSVARELGASPAQVRIAWTLHRGRHVLAIPGTSNLGHLRENIAAASIRLGADHLRRLDAIGRSTS